MIVMKHIKEFIIEGLRINKEWFESTGMEMPKTTEDIYNILKKTNQTYSITLKTLNTPTWKAIR